MNLQAFEVNLKQCYLQLSKSEFAAQLIETTSVLIESPKTVFEIISNEPPMDLASELVVVAEDLLELIASNQECISGIEVEDPFRLDYNIKFFRSSFFFFIIVTELIFIFCPTDKESVKKCKHVFAGYWNVVKRSGSDILRLLIFNEIEEALRQMGDIIIIIKYVFGEYLQSSIINKPTHFSFIVEGIVKSQHIELLKKI